MPSRDLTISTSKPAGFSAGVSQNIFTAPWDLASFEVIETSGADPRLQIRWRQDVAGARFDHDITCYPQQTSGVPVPPHPVLYRVLSHVLLNQIPDQAIPDAYVALFQICGYSSHQQIIPVVVGVGLRALCDKLNAVTGKPVEEALQEIRPVREQLAKCLESVDEKLYFLNERAEIGNLQEQDSVRKVWRTSARTVHEYDDLPCDPDEGSRE